MQLGNTLNILSNYLQNYKGSEVEIRFGKYKWNKNTQKKEFESKVDIEFFYNLKRGLDNNKNFKKEKQNTEEYIKGSVKKIVNEGNIKYMIKNKLKNFDCWDYNFRISVSEEKTTNEIEFEKLDKECFVRIKNRHSYIIDGLVRIDLTRVNNQHFEVEIECYSNSGIKQILEGVLQTREKNKYVMTSNEKNKILNEFKTLIESYFFVGAQPETLQKNDIANLYKNKYAVTIKADGERVMLFINNKGECFFIDNNLNNVWQTNMRSEMKDCIIDGELLISDTLDFYGFDILFYNGEDLRKKEKCFLRERLALLKELTDKTEQNSEYKLKMKDYYTENVFVGIECLEKINKTKCDGYIFVPMEENYPMTKKWSGLYKWKPEELNTIDFYSVKEGNLWKLYVQKPVKENPKKTEKVLFDIDILTNDTTNERKYMTSQTVFPDTILDETTGEEFMGNTVIEYYWNKEKELFYPIRTRWDKTINETKHGNFCKVACDIWNSIHNPVSLEYLKKFTVSKNTDKYFERMRKNHNWIKMGLYNKYCKDIDSLLELSSGRGGDLQKWKYNNIKKVIGYDVSLKNIEECKSRIEREQLTNYKFYQLDLNKENADEIIYRDNEEKFKVVCCHFAMHYFYESDKTIKNFIKILDTNLENGGVFIATFMDDKKIEELMKDEDILVAKDANTDEVVYKLEKKNREISIRLSGPNILGEGSNEWIVPCDEFIKVMKECGYELVETQLFNENKFEMNEYERKISELNRYVVFRKNNRTIQNIKKEESIFTPTYDNEYSNIILNDLYTAIKINDLYNIIEIMNCIEYKWDKLEYENESIKNKDDILRIMKKLNIEYYFEEYNIGKKSPIEHEERVHVTSFSHELEKYDNELGEVVKTKYDNFYILMYDGRILYKNNIKIPEENKEKVQEKEEMDYSQMTVKQLKELLKIRGLAVSGNKSILVERLMNN